MKDLPSTDLLQARVRLKPGAVPYAMKGHRRMLPRHQAFFETTINEGLDCGLYERTPVGEKISPWSAPPVIVVKVPDDPNSDLRLTFDYSHVDEIMPGNPIVLASEVMEAMGKGKCGALGQGDLKHGYWLTMIEEESRKIRTFRVPGIGQVRPTRMPQGLGSSGHHFHKLGYLAFGEIPEPNPEPLLLGPEFRVYIDDMFRKHAGFWEQLFFIRDH